MKQAVSGIPNECLFLLCGNYEVTFQPSPHLISESPGLFRIENNMGSSCMMLLLPMYIDDIVFQISGAEAGGRWGGGGGGGGGGMVMKIDCWIWV